MKKEWEHKRNNQVNILKICFYKNSVQQQQAPTVIIQQQAPQPVVQPMIQPVVQPVVQQPVVMQPVLMQ